MKMNKFKNKNKNQETNSNCMPFLVFWWGSFAVPDHLRSSLGIISGLGTFAVGDHLQHCTVPKWQATTSSVLVWSNCGSNLTMHSSDSLFPCYTVPQSLGGKQLLVCFSATWIQILLIPLQMASPLFASLHKRDHLRIHAVTCTKCCQVSYLNASLGILSWTVARQTVSFMPTDLFLASIRHCSGTAFIISLTGQSLHGCCNQCGPIHHSLRYLSLDAGILLVTRSAGFWLPGQNLHWLDATRWWISWTLFATNTFH